MKCVFCGAEQDGNPPYVTWFVLMPFEVEFAVCHKCRNKSINDAFYELIKKQMRDADWLVWGVGENYIREVVSK